MPTTTTTYDTNDQFNWTSKVNTFDDDGALQSSTVLYDNGVQRMNTYLYGFAVTSVTNDAEEGGGVYGWTTRTDDTLSLVPSTVQ